MAKDAKNTSWGKVASWYDQTVLKPDSYQQTVLLPNLQRLIAPRPGQTILDLACGQGLFAGAFAAAGATVLGADIAPELIALAKKQTPGAKFYVAPADKLSFLKEKSVDTVVCVLALQNIKNVPDTLRECARVLRPGGRLAIVLNHPAFRIPQASSWQWDETTKTQYRRTDKYLSEITMPIEMHPGSDKKKTTVSFHRPLQYYFKLLHNHGFVVSRLEEWISPKTTLAGPRATAENKARKEFPLFLFIEARQD